MNLEDTQKKIEACNEKINYFNLQVENLLSEETQSMDKLTSLINVLDSTIDELQQLITSIE